MKKNKIFFYFITINLVILISCSEYKLKKIQSRSGWKINDKNGWFFSQKKQNRKKWIGMVYIEGGTFTKGAIKDDILKLWNTTPKRVQVRSFFLGETEVTNFEYREYVTWLKFVFNPSEIKYKNIYNGALPDTTVWKNKLSQSEIYTEEYFRQPNFDYYPVVGVTWLQAQRYCDWLTDRANEKELMNRGVIKKDLYSNNLNNQGPNHFNCNKYKYNDSELKSILNIEKIKKITGITTKNNRIFIANKNQKPLLVAKFRLPTESEWEYAALALAENREYNMYKIKQTQIQKLRGTKWKKKGMYLENFKMGRGDYSGIAGWPNDGSTITSNVKKYPSNQLGIYGMLGNVAEWCEDVYQPSEKNQNNNEKQNNTSINFDTLSDGRVLYRKLPGSFDKKNIQNTENIQNKNIQYSIKEVNNFYFPSFKITNNGKIILNQQKKNKKFFNEELRVVKGGSWKDGFYWLDPEKTRFLHQTKSSCWIGFRVAQDLMGENLDKKRFKRGIYHN